MAENFNLLRASAAESYAAGVRDSRHFMQLYRAYLRGAYDAAGGNADSGFRLTLAAMTFALAAWFITMYFVFK